MKRALAGWVLGCVVLVAAGRVEAQAIGGGFGGPRVFVGAGGPTALTPGFGYSSVYAGSAPALSGPAIPYSYYVLPSSEPSRVYVGPGNYPFYGHPYGYIYDRWTWPYMSGASAGMMARYYYPPLGF